MNNIIFNLRELTDSDREKQYYFILENVVANDSFDNDYAIKNKICNIEIYGRSWKISESNKKIGAYDTISEWEYPECKPCIKLIEVLDDKYIVDIDDKGSDSAGQYCIYYTMSKSQYESLTDYVDFVENNLLYFASCDTNLDHDLYALKSNTTNNINVATLTGIEFEHLIAQLLIKMNFAVQATKASGDGGIDLIVNNSDPIFSMKAIVQCKRYSGSVGQPIIRDLYGVIMSEGANKGILITTGYFTASAKKFAKGKPIELIDGITLDSLLKKYEIICKS